MNQEINCALCGLVKPLQRSHIIPKFVYRYIKETSATGFLRHAMVPNQRIQDGIKIDLLCLECERLFSKDEDCFKDNIFDQIILEKKYDLRYGEPFLRFAASISWRVIKYFQREKAFPSVTLDFPLKTSRPGWSCTFKLR